MISVFLPTRKGSERVHDKNTRDFAGMQGGLLNNKLMQLTRCEKVGEIVLSTNDPASIGVAGQFEGYPGLKIIQRPEQLALSTTSLTDLVRYAPSICAFDHILWTHVTAPFTGAADYDAMIDAYFRALEQGFDSLMTVRPIHNFIWDRDANDLINRITDEKWPRTQDLKVYFEVNNAVFLSSKALYEQCADRIGKRPYLYEQDPIKGFDVDWETDFKMAEMLYKAFHGTD